MSLSLCLGSVVVPRLVSVGVGLPHVFQHRVDEGFADKNAQVDHQVGIHRPAGRDNKQLVKRLFTIYYILLIRTACVKYYNL